MQRYFCLTPVLGGPGAPRYPVSDHKQIIGRSEEADIALLEPTVSRKHACITLSEGEIWLEDMESKHGTFVNSKRITHHRLKVGDLIVIGLSIVLRLEESDAVVPPAEPLRVPTRVRAHGGKPRTGERRAASSGQHRRHLTGDTALSWTVESKQRQTRELRRVKEDLVRARKLASIGAFCVDRLPAMFDRVGKMMEGARAMASGQRPEQMEPRRLLAELETMHADLERLVNVSRTLPPSQVQITQLEDPLRMAMAMVGPEAETNGHKLLLEIAPALQVRADPRRLALAMRHLLYSAVQSAAKGTPVTVGVNKQAERATVAIRTQGEGIPDEVLTEIFDPFLTNSTHWLRFGLGLFEARQIIMSFGGTVELESKDGQGTEIRALLPLARD